MQNKTVVDLSVLNKRVNEFLSRYAELMKETLLIREILTSGDWALTCEDFQWINENVRNPKLIFDFMDTKSEGYHSYFYFI